MTQYENHELKRLDAEIAELEARISFKQEQRREIINRKDLNKMNIKVVISESFHGVSVSDSSLSNYPGAMY